jgi:hypothetical protein
MKITKTFNWNRMDFSYDTKCEHCGNIVKNIGCGYDDNNFYNNVIPNQVCKKCGESTNSKISDEPKTKVIPKYNPNLYM